ncbi:hypothetical protein ACFV98_26895 [Streptomyces violascens]|uniref:hypothetical protein n=1 Tax=Streptomyces violascens TaxID=67381 RepID=UPI0036614E57
MTHSAGPPTRGRRRPDLRHWLRPQSPQTLVFGICVSVGGLAGGARWALDGGGIWKALGMVGVGVLGVLIVLSYFVNLDKR